MTILLIGLIFSLLIYAWKIVSWGISIVKIYKKDEKTLEIVEMFYSKNTPKVQKFLLLIALLEHLTIFGSLLAATLIIF
jgi:hypothetical protein